MIHLVAVNRAQKIAFFDDGSISRLEHFVDRFGDDTDDVEDAVSAITLAPNGMWTVIDLSRFGKPTLH